MNKTALICILLFTTAVSAAESFGARVQRAKVIEDSADGQSFQKELWAHIGDHTAKVMQRCFPKDVKTDTDSFTLVANLTAARALAGVEVQPETSMSLCFARGLNNVPFPKPPDTFGLEGMPLVIEMKIKP